MAIYESGIDVSRYQGSIDWSSVAAAGKQFAIVRLGSSNGGGAYVDPNFRTNVDGAHAAGLKVGAYYYTYATTQAAVIQELETYLPALEGLQLEYPVFVDVEASNLESVGTDALSSLVEFAMNILYQRKWYAGWYTYTFFAQTYLNASALAAYPFWIADYLGYVSFDGTYDMWQYSDTGNVSGISGNVDLDYSYRNFLPDIRAGGYNGYTASDPEFTPVSGKSLEVISTNAQYYTTVNGTAAGNLPIGVYPVTATTTTTVGGNTWAELTYNGNTVYAPIISGQTQLVDTATCDCTEVTQQLAEANQKIAAAQAALDNS